MSHAAPFPIEVTVIYGGAIRLNLPHERFPSDSRASTLCPLSRHLCHRSDVIYSTVTRGSGSLRRWSLRCLSSHSSILFITSPDDWDEKVLCTQLDENLLAQRLILVSSCRCLCSKISICVNSRAADRRKRHQNELYSEV